MKQKQIPKRIKNLLDRRNRLATSLISVCCEIDEYCERLGIDDDDAAIGGHVMIYCEPYNAQIATERAILAALN